jgi:hypothetical protein
VVGFQLLVSGHWLLADGGVEVTPHRNHARLCKPITEQTLITNCQSLITDY